MNEFLNLVIIAQAYNCGAYGEAAYNQCPQDPAPPTPGGGGSAGGSSGASGADTGTGQATDIGGSDQSSNAQTSDTPVQNPNDNADADSATDVPAGTTVQPGSLEMTAKDTGIGYDVIFFIAFGIALLLALIILLIKRLRRRDKLEQFDGNDTFNPHPPTN